MLKGSRDPGAATVIFVGGAAVIAGGIAAGHGEVIPRAAWGWTAASGAIEAFYFATLSIALTRLPLGTAYGVVRGGGQLVTWPLSVLLLGEAIGPKGTIGALLVAGGLFGTASGPGSRDGLGWAALCAVATGVYPLMCKAALGAGAPQSALFAVSLSIALPVQIAALGPTRMARLRAEVGARGPMILVGAALCAGSFLAFLAALDQGGAGRAVALRNTSVLVAAGLAWWRGEAMNGSRVVSALAIAVGAVLVAG